MTDDRMAVLETVRKAIADGDVDFLREGVRVLAEAVMEAEVTEVTGVPHGERDPEHRLTRRNGYRERRWDTRVGSVGVYSTAEAIADSGLDWDNVDKSRVGVYVGVTEHGNVETENEVYALKGFDYDTSFWEFVKNADPNTKLWVVDYHR